MRGTDTSQTRLFYQISYDQVIPENHPLRHIRRVVDQALSEMDGLFQRMYAQMGRPSIAPERLLRALLIEVLYSIRSDRQLVERLRFDLLVKWFVGLEIDEEGWDASTFSRNRDRLMEYDVSRKFFERVLAEAHRRRLLSEKHFTVISCGKVGLRKHLSDRSLIVVKSFVSKIICPTLYMSPGNEGSPFSPVSFFPL